MDENSFKAFLAKAQPYCMSRLQKLTQSKATAEDVFWEAAFQLWRDFQMDKVKNQRNLKALLFVMAKNLYFNQIRKNKSKPEYSTDPQQMPLMEGAAGGSTSLNEVDHLVKAEETESQLKADQQRNQAFQKAMKKLGEKCQQLLTKFIVEKQRMKTLQQSLGYPSANAVKMAKLRCKKKLITFFEEELKALPK